MKDTRVTWIFDLHVRHFATTACRCIFIFGAAASHLAFPNCFTALSAFLPPLRFDLSLHIPGPVVGVVVGLFCSFFVVYVGAPLLFCLDTSVW